VIYRAKAPVPILSAAGSSLSLAFWQGRDLRCAIHPLSPYPTLPYAPLPSLSSPRSCVREVVLLFRAY